MSGLVKAVGRRRAAFCWALFFLALAGMNVAVLWPEAFGRHWRQTATGSQSSAPKVARAGGGAVPPKARSPGDPHLELSTLRLDLGDGKPNETLRGEITLRNTGGAPLEFSLIKHCGCTELAPLSGTVPPGAAETLHVGIKLADHANSEKNTTVDIHSNDPELPAVQCAVLARCPAPFKVSPAFIDFGSLTAEELATASHEVRLDSVGGQPPFDPEKLLMSHLNDAFVVQRVAPAHHSLVLRVALKEGLPPGDVSDSLDLRLADSDQTMRVSLHATLVEAISVVPPSVWLRRETNGGFRPEQLLVACRHGRALGKVSLQEGPPGLRVEDVGASSAGWRRLRLSVSGSVSDWADTNEVWLHGDGSDARFGFRVCKPSAPGGAAPRLPARTPSAARLAPGD